MAWNLDGRVALITGGASGDRRRARPPALGPRHRLGLIDQTPSAGGAIVPGAETAVADVRDAEALTAAIDELARRLGGIDVAVANAGIATGGPLRMIEPRTFEDTIDVNLLGVWRTIHAALPHVLALRGHLLLIASAAAGSDRRARGVQRVQGGRRVARALAAGRDRPHGVTWASATTCSWARRWSRRRASPVFRDSKSRMPAPIAKTWPLEPAVARTVASIEKRSRAVAHPPFLRAIMALRGLLDTPLTDRARSGGRAAHGAGVRRRGRADRRRRRRSCVGNAAASERRP